MATCRQLREHLFDRAEERNITMEDLFALEEVA